MQIEKIRQADEMSIRKTAFDRLWELAGFEVSPQGFDENDMRKCGDIVYEKAMRLSKKINHDLLIPIAGWIDDPNWIKKYELIENKIPNWGDYKRKQRQWSKQQKTLAIERLKLYWQEIRKKRTFRSELHNIISRASPRGSPRLDLTSYFLTPIIAPFSPKEQQRAETNFEFQQARELSISNLLPWQVLITSEFNSKDLIRFTELKTYAEENPKSDTVAKLQHILQMETEGKIKLQQAEPYGEISIESIDPDQESTITVKDQSGRHYEFDWCDLSDAQRNKVIADIKANKILCKTI